MSDDAAERHAGATVHRLLEKDYWLVWSTPLASVDSSEFGPHVDEHVDWMLELEAAGVLFASGPLLSGPGIRGGAGMTILRAADEQAAREIAEQDPFVRAGLRDFTVFMWRLNEGSVEVRLSLGSGTHEWH